MEPPVAGPVVERDGGELVVELEFPDADAVVDKDGAELVVEFVFPVAVAVVDTNRVDDVVETGNEEVPVARVAVLVVAGAVTIRSVRPQTIFSDTGREVT